MIRFRLVLVWSLLALASLALSGLPSWFHLTARDHEPCASGCTGHEDHSDGGQDHDSRNCSQCQYLHSQEVLEPAGPLALIDWIFRNETPPVQDRRILPAARHHLFPPCRAPPAPV